MYNYNGKQKREVFVGFENACFRAKTYVMAFYAIMYIDADNDEPTFSAWMFMCSKTKFCHNVTYNISSCVGNYIHVYTYMLYHKDKLISEYLSICMQTLVYHSKRLLI